MIRHVRDCTKNPNKEVDRKIKTINVGKDFEDDPNVASMKLVEFNQEQILIALAKMIILDELPFKFVKNEGFRKFIEKAQPYFKILSCVIIARYCIQVFNDEKEKLKCMLSTNIELVSLTTNTWRSIQNLN